MIDWKCLPIAALLCGSAMADVELARVFTRGMVLQRDAAHPVFGSAMPGSTVTVEFAGQTRETTADSYGYWRVVLDPMAANDREQTLTVASEGKRKQLQELLVGDVWICVGDALMAQGNGAYDARNFTEDRLIRQYGGRSIGFHMPLDDFMMPSLVKRGIDKDLKSQNLIALGFAVRIREVSGVPVYMFNVASGKHGSPYAWMSPQGHQFLSDLNGDKKRELLAVDPQSDTGRAAYLRAHQAVSEWLEEAAARVAAGQHPRPYPEFPNEESQLSDAYNAYLHPLRSLPCKGILWFSMIRDSASVAQREERLSALFQSWRQVFNRPDLPIYTAQLYDPFPINTARPGGVSIGEVRAALPVLKMENTGVAVSHDLNDVGEFRLPAEGEYELGQRMALWAEHQVYGRDISFSGPIYKRHVIKGNAFVIEFEHGDVMNAADGGEIHGFYIAGNDNRFKPARVEVAGAHAKVWSDEVPNPVRLTYATSNAEPRANLVNNARLPAAAFVLGEQP